MLGNKRMVALLVAGLLAPLLTGLAIHRLQTPAVLILSAPWLNWALYTLGFLAATLVGLIGARVMRSRWMLVMAFGYFYWAIGVFIGALQTGANPTIVPGVALPYIRSMWLIGSLALIVATLGLLVEVVRIEGEIENELSDSSE